jgi:hypothetical protein
MNFFVMDEHSLRVKASPMVWIYVLSSVVLTATTGMLYYWVTRRTEDENSSEVKLQETSDKKLGGIHISGVRRRLNGMKAQTPFHGV